jgi:signal transduction histidine kinase
MGDSPDEVSATILNVDDDPANRYAVTRTLRRAGYTVREAGTGQEALALARENPDLILLDVQLPDVTGFEVCQRLKADPATAPIPVLQVSASYVTSEDRVQGLEGGADGYLVTPLEPRELVAQVKAMLRVRRAEARERAARAELEAANARLRSQQEELLRVSRAKDDFLGMLAHELRNPLGPILNGLHILRLSANNRQALEQARAVMERQLRHLSRLVDELLDMSRYTRGRVELQLERLDLARLVRTTAEDYRPTLERAGLTLDVEVAGGPAWVTGDATRLPQALNNLLENAAKFTDRGGRVVVRLTVGADRREAVLSVRDTGIGIEPEMMPRLFDVFAQADRSLDRTRGGLGLGLSIVKRLVELHGGEVAAASAGAGRGAEFTIRLPLVAEPPALVAVPTAAAPPGERLRVLVVEDNRDAAESLRMLLELLGNEVSVAHTGPDGVRLAHEWQPDVVLCDIGLPGGLDGFGVATELRQDPATAKARLIAITGYGSDKDRERARRAGFDYHLTKPADPAALQQLLGRPAGAGERPA